MAGFIGAGMVGVANGSERKQTYAITQTTTNLTGLAYTPTKVHVFHNGIRLVDGTDYTATNGTSITLTTAAEDGDEVVVISNASFQTSDTVSASNGGTFAGNVSMSGTLDVTGATTLSSDLNVGTIKDATGTNTGLTVSSDGYVLTPNRPSFRAYDVANVTKGVTGAIVFNTLAHNVGGDYDATTGVFTAPVGGTYQFNFLAFNSNSSGNMVASNSTTNVILQKNSTTTLMRQYNQVQAAGYHNMSFSSAVSLAANDTIRVYVSGGYIYTDTSGAYLQFSGYLVG